ncbi:MAG: hypothetical protein RLY14_2075 [Planctomycetota bacterium]|jgi:hypothetical protein
MEDASKYALVLLVCFCGCDRNRDSASKIAFNSIAEHNVSDQSVVTSAEPTAYNIEPGFYRDGADYERVSGVLAKSDAHILLDYQSGVECYDKISKTRSKPEDINDVKSLLASIENKHVVTVSTGKAAWDKYDEYIAKVAGFADELGFDMTIVTDDNAQGLVISKVIQHKN